MWKGRMCLEGIEGSKRGDVRTQTHPKTLPETYSVQAMSGKWEPLKDEQCETAACPGIHCSVFRLLKSTYFLGRVFTM